MAEYDYPKPNGQTDGDRIPPQNLDAERAVLAAAILNPEVLQELITLIPESRVFYRPAHQKIYDAVTELYERGIPVDQLSLAERLKTRGQLDEVGGKPYIIELANNAFALANWRTHVDIVKRCSLLRDLIAASTQITAMGYDAPDDAASVVDDAEKLIFSVTDRHISNGFTGLNDLLQNTFDSVSAMADMKTHVIGVRTGFYGLDKLLAGLRGGSLMIIAARPAVGKTSFVLNLGINAAKLGTRVALFSLEMSAAEIAPRIIASESGIALQHLRSGELQENEWTRFAETANKLSTLDFSIDDTPSLSILEMRAKARRQLHGCEKDKGLIIVDYLQLMQPSGKRNSDNRQVEIAEISRGLKILAKEMDVPVIALSQLSRAVEQRGDRKPMLSDLRESGAIEQDADIVTFLDRSTSPEEEADPKRPDKGVANLIIAKNRSGPTGNIPLVFVDSCTRFSDPPPGVAVAAGY